MTHDGVFRLRKYSFLPNVSAIPTRSIESCRGGVGGVVHCRKPVDVDCEETYVPAPPKA